MSGDTNDDELSSLTVNDGDLDARQQREALRETR